MELPVTILGTRLMRWLSDFWEICGPLVFKKCCKGIYTGYSPFQLYCS